jgi:hypothetical protein
MTTEQNPLEKITTWLTNLPSDIRQEIIAIGGHFHPDEKIYSAIGQKQVDLFTEYLDSKSINDREIVIRTFLVIKLIDHAVSGRDTEAGWTETLDRHISLGARLKEKGQSTEMVDNFVSTYEKRKDVWIKTSNDWHGFKESNINDRQIADWYFFKTLK